MGILAEVHRIEAAEVHIAGCDLVVDTGTFWGDERELGQNWLNQMRQM